MTKILGNHTSRIVKRILSFRKADSVLSLIRQILRRIPLETDLRYRRSLPYVWVFSHMYVWRSKAMLRRRLTSQLSGARLRRFNRSYFIPIHRFPPMLNEDDDACPLQRKLGPSRPVARFASMVCHGQYLHDRIRLAINDRIRKSA